MIRHPKKSFFFYSYVYGLHSVTEMRELWKSLLKWGYLCNESWIIVGDFNCVKSPNERVRGYMPTSYKINDFFECATTLDCETFSQCFVIWLKYENLCEMLSKYDEL